MTGDFVPRNRHPAVCMTASLFLLAQSSLAALPINSNAALNPYEGGVIVRQQVIATQSHRDNEEVSRVAAPLAVAYGVTSRFSLLAVLPYNFLRQRNSPQIGSLTEKKDSHDSAFADAKLAGKYIYFRHDLIGATLRLALPLTVTIPTRETGFSQNAYSGSLGQVFTYQSTNWEFDAAFAFETFDVSEGIRRGNRVTYDAALQFRILPWTLPDEGVPAFLNFVFEINGETQEETIRDGASLANTGGRILFFSPGLQFASERYVIEASYQKPIQQRWNGNSRGRRDQFTIEERYRFGIRLLL